MVLYILFIEVKRSRTIDQLCESICRCRSEKSEKEAAPGPDDDALSVPSLLLAGDEAAQSFDYATARARFEAALAHSGGAREPPSALEPIDIAFTWSARRPLASPVRI